MNKTVNINIGGIFFHIDEDAYQKLSRYFDSIRKSLTNSGGKDEIMKDIEMRVAELFTEKQKSDKHVINNKDVDEVVAVMGQPEDYRLEEENESNGSYTSSAKTKKLYRDKDKATIGGVCTGLGHYFAIDPIWIKILLIIITLAGFGFGIIAYIVLWVVIPEAKTTSEKLEMTGEPVNISSIEKKVKEEFEAVSEKIKNVDYDKIGNQLKSTTTNAGGKLGDIIIKIFNIFAKIIGAFITMIAGSSLIAIFFGAVFFMFSSSLPESIIMNHIETPISLDTPLWLQGILFLLVCGIPVFFLLILGLKLMINNLKSIGTVAKLTLLATWIIATAFTVYLGVKESMIMNYSGKNIKKEMLTIKPNDTLFVKFKTNDFYSKDVTEKTSYDFTQDETKKNVIYSNNVSLEVLSTDEKTAYLQIEKYAVGTTASLANNRAESMKYKFNFDGKKLILDNYFISEMIHKSRNQEVKLYLYLPKGTLVKFDKSVQEYDESDNNYFNLHFSSDNYIYKAEESKLICLNCPADENEYNDVDVEYGIDADSLDINSDNLDNAEIKLNKDGILVKVNETKNSTKNQNNQETKSIKIDKNGVSIKSK